MRPPNNVVVLDVPVETDALSWLATHPECDSIIEDVEGRERTIRVFAYTTDYNSNRSLEQFRDSNFANMTILMGMTRDAVNSLL